MSQPLALYYTSGCHLCDLAEDVLRNVKQIRDFSWKKVDIADDDLLVDTYGIRIPVVQRMSDKKELGWPFDEQALIQFLDT